MSDYNVTKATDTAIEQKTSNKATLYPLVNIVEQDKGFTITAEMPGVPKDQIAVQVENGVLMLQGDIALDVPEGMEATHAEVKNASYYRRFTLSRELDTAKIEAAQQDGILTVKIPKFSHAQARKIKVEVA